MKRNDNTATCLVFKQEMKFRKKKYLSRRRYVTINIDSTLLVYTLLQFLHILLLRRYMPNK